MSTPVPQQKLTFDVGGQVPTESLLRLSGALHTHRELHKGEEIHCQIVDADGVVVADGYGQIVGVTFRDKLDDYGYVVSSERIHSVKAA